MRFAPIMIAGILFALAGCGSIDPEAYVLLAEPTVCDPTCHPAKAAHVATGDDADEAPDGGAGASSAADDY